MSKAMIEIDGSQGEGGGQILRTSLALSLITGKPFHLRNIRAGRAKPGLHAQHLMCVESAAEIGRAKTRGAHLHSIDLVFEPGEVRTGSCHFKIGTAGATSLVLHTVYLPLALSGGPCEITIEGGTHVKASPCFHFLDRTWSRYLHALDVNIGLRMDRVGFYPRGGGMIHAHIPGIERIRVAQWQPGLTSNRATVVCLLAGLPAHVGERMRRTAEARLTELNLEVEVLEENLPGGPGCMLGIELATSPAPTFLFALGERGKPAETVAHEACDEVVQFLSADPLGVDEHSADQLLLPLALADGSSEFRAANVSSHLLTNVDVIGHFLDRIIVIEGKKRDPGLVQVR